ncbi:hypothetical protein L485_22475 [Sphingobium baderi LL03]|uniref:Uncharacterized protein n=2 Tax=Sphingobium baderi TaxID=1332080 RepID=T0HBX5_9SPHN|nr:hypothetical protein L485_22475 [Sphingobium baderi LL03]
MRGEASFEADGETYVITMNADALMMAENITGKPISTILALFDSGAHLGMTAALAWSGTYRQYAIPYDEMADRVLRWGVPMVREAVSKAMQHAWPEKEEEEANPPKRGRRKAAAGTG